MSERTVLLVWYVSSNIYLQQTASMSTTKKHTCTTRREQCSGANCSAMQYRLPFSGCLTEG